MDAVLILLNTKTGWDNAKKIMNDANFLKNMLEYPKDQIQDKTIKKLDPIVKSEGFNADNMAKKSSAAASLC